jgi:hypothetical protein
MIVGPVMAVVWPQDMGMDHYDLHARCALASAGRTAVPAFRRHP